MGVQSDSYSPGFVAAGHPAVVVFKLLFLLGAWMSRSRGNNANLNWSWSVAKGICLHDNFSGLELYQMKRTKEDEIFCPV